MRVVVHTDGNRHAGAAVVYDVDGTKIAERARIMLDATVPICEYMGLLCGLSLAHELGATNVTCWMDAELVQRHVVGEYVCRDEKLKPYLAAVRSWLPAFQQAKVVLFPKAGPRMKRRHLNVDADALASECARLGRDLDRVFFDAGVE